jgi:hypothetical protein
VNIIVLFGEPSESEKYTFTGCIGRSNEILGWEGVGNRQFSILVLF